ncbi:MAG: hypothetical protein A3B38_01400 [Candidatus Levybacteria bacterium RIFCSPLOWO2_01_FULL_36_13]|nr:MAG: hypothetical protein A2684_02635 [Candidatus Levybacteria bacterium RIFCSPHIGHO2_01_FULL_36_15b]OGH35529.1 MAG: hypothetical protein A3B38_01400 [Candidatus Levybacteria bacterium RIFCSPLOWO2_01_FULL_36_13]
MVDKKEGLQPKVIDKQEVVNRLRLANEDLRETISRIDSRDLERTQVTDEGWTVKDVLSHLAAWNTQYLIEINGILRNDASWQKFYEDKAGEDEFNRLAVEERKAKPFSQVFDEWSSSINRVIERVEALSLAEWIYQSGSDVWSDGSPITVYSLFNYSYNNKPHEAGHAQAIRERLGLDKN